MILILEQDVRPWPPNTSKRWQWYPSLFKGIWREKRTWRICWGLWSLSYYPELGLHDFFRYIEQGNGRWYDR
jgi:hypothetical protein